jgi:hypothetical protein
MAKFLAKDPVLLELQIEFCILDNPKQTKTIQE